jgi:alginate O-acetyltransferase complex protein AlgI
MSFHSARFLIFLGLTFVLYWRFADGSGRRKEESNGDFGRFEARRKWLRLGVLAAASFVFYAVWHLSPMLVLSGYAALNYLAGQLLARLQHPAARKAVVTAAVLLQLGGLFIHKYVNLLLRTVGDLATRFDWQVHPEPLQLVVPMGLSFVTFQSISYVVDVYRGKADGQYSPLHHWLYLLFFPRVVAGPIVRSSELLAHFDTPQPLTRQSGLEALFRITQGLLKKLLLADVLAAALIDPVYADPASYTAAECVVATVAYTFQIYFDFSGYSDLAVGTAGLFGFKLPENFNQPYHARNLFEFWNRWHLSLSTWLRDYLYRPLGGNKGSKLQTLRNLFLVMLLGGLWHGADWKFAVWGGLHGMALVVLRILWWWRGKPEYETRLSRVFGVATTFSVVVLSRVFFRAETVGKGLEVFAQMFTLSWGLQRISVLAALTLASCVLLYVLPRRVFEGARALFERTPVLLRVAVLVGLVLLIKSVSSAETQPYIYRQF